MRWLPGFLAAFLLVGAFFVSSTPVEGGGRTLEGWWVAMAGITLVVTSAFGIFGSRSGLLAGLSVVGMAAQLAVVRPHWLQYFRFRPWEISANTMPIAVTIVAVQALLVLLLMKRHTAEIRTFAGGLARPGRMVLLLLALLFCGAHFSLIWPHLPDGRRLLNYLAQLLIAVGFTTLNVASLFLLVRSLPGEKLEAVRNWMGSRISLPGYTGPTLPGDRLLPWGLAIFVLVVTVFLSRVVLDGVPHVPDGVAYLFQAKTYALGQLETPAPPVPEAFEHYLVDNHDRTWFGVTHPGWPATLALGVLLGVPWLVNPILAALAILATHALARRLTHRGMAHLVTMLLATSPWFLYLGASWMTHMASYLALVVGWILIHRARESGRVLPAVLSGMAMGYILNIRPLDGLLAGILTGLWCLRGGRWKTALAFSMGCIILTMPLLFYNDAMSGNHLEFPISSYTDRIWHPGANSLGFGAEIGDPAGTWGLLDPFPGHGWRDVLLNTNQNLYNLNFELLGWPMASILPIILFLALGRWTREDRWLLLFAAILLVSYNLYWFSGGPDYGPRYWFLCLFPCLWFSVRGLQAVVDRGFISGSRLSAVVVLLCIVSTCVFLPWRAVSKYADYRGFHGDLRRLAEQHDLSDAVVVLRYEDDSDYSSAFLLNDPLLQKGQAIFAREIDESTTQRLREAFPDRHLILVEGRSLGGVGGVTKIVEQR